MLIQEAHRILDSKNQWFSPQVLFVARLGPCHSFRTFEVSGAKLDTPHLWIQML